MQAKKKSLAIATRYRRDARVMLLRGDSSHILESVPAKCINLVLSSPPYNLGKEYENKLSLDEFLPAMRMTCAMLARAVRDDGAICWQVGNFVQHGEIIPLDIIYYEIFKNLGFKLRNRIVWHYRHGLHSSKRFSGRYETILWFTRGDKYTFNLDPVRVPAKYPGKRHHRNGPSNGKPSCNPLGKNPSDVWEVLQRDWESGVWDVPNVKANHPEKTIHVCQFPIELAERCILALTNPKDVVLDPFAGVGSTIVASLKNGRRAIGIDRERRYLAEAKRRILLLHNGKLPYRPLGKPVHEPTGNEQVARIPAEWKQYPSKGNKTNGQKLR